MIIVQLSDLHICRHGTRLTQLRDVARRATNGKGWETVRQEGDWAFQTKKGNGGGLLFRDRMRLVDEMGVVHRVVKLERGKAATAQAMGVLRRHMEARERTTPHDLAKRFPSVRDLQALLARDPENLNLRFCAAARAVREQNPDQIVISGDLTDDAEGFELILEGLAPFFERGRVNCVPGNHDVYPSPPLWVQKAHRKREAEKRMLWATFAQSIDHPPQGPHVRDLGDGIVLVCLDSCHRARVPGSASGLVPLRDLHRVARELDALGERVRIACLHHHVVNPSLAGLRLAPIQAGMRLRNAPEVFNVLRELQFDLVMNGHRHIGYRFHPAHAPLFLSAPSTTIGCRSGAHPFFWRVDVRRDGVRSVREVKIPPL